MKEVRQEVRKEDEKKFRLMRRENEREGGGREGKRGEGGGKEERK